MKNKIVAIASAGGHWTQLLRLLPAFEDNVVVYVSTKENFSTMVKGNEYYVVPNSNRWSKFNLLRSFCIVFKIIIKTKPNVIITTGAAPGLMAIIIGKILGIRTLWIDSIANVDEISMSGKIATRFADKVYTQWPKLAKGKVLYYGNVISL